MAGVLLLPTQAYACACSDSSGKGTRGNPCHGLNSGQTCYPNGGTATGTCTEQTAGKCDCKCVV
jgi:hypothetical protein